jgi:hypothetical protein
VAQSATSIACLGIGKMSLGTGLDGQLHDVADQLHTWFFSKREQSMANYITHIIWKAQKFIGTKFKDKSFNAKFHATSHWLKKF